MDRECCAAAESEEMEAGDGTLAVSKDIRTAVEAKHMSSFDARHCPCLPFPVGPTAATVHGNQLRNLMTPKWTTGPPPGAVPGDVKVSESSLKCQNLRRKPYEIQVRNLNYKLSTPPMAMGRARRNLLLRKLMRFLPRKLRANLQLPDHPNAGVTPATDSPLREPHLPQMQHHDVHHHRYILRDISFDAKAGELLAIAGPSGAGKSTLLEVVAGRARPTSPSSVLVNNQVMDVAYFRRVSGYIMQDDALFPTLTVLETLLFSARLRLPPATSLAKKKARVDALLVELGLEHVAGTRIGNDIIRGVSGGERRRVSIGVDVVHDPSVLILDEPTSGLDSAAAMNIVAMLRSMAESRNCTVILSIHQPNFRILELMHSILLLAEGTVVHHGSLELLASRLEVAGHMIPAQVNVLEYAIEAMNSWRDDYGKFSNELNQQLAQTMLLNAQQQNSVKIIVDPQKGPEFGVQDEPNLDGDVRTGRKKDRASFSNPNAQEIVVLATRCFKNVVRTKELFAARTVQALAAGFTLGTIFLNSSKGGTEGVQERLSFFAFSLTFFLSGSTEALPIFLQERQIVTRETSRGAYRISSYMLSSAIVFAPFLLVMALVYCHPAYFLVKLFPSPSAFFFFSLVMWLVLLEANSFVSFFAALVPNFIMANSLIAIFMGAFFLFSGYFISKDRIPRFWLFMHYLSMLKYPLDALMSNEFGRQPDKCFDDQQTNAAAGRCLVTGSQVLSQAGIGGGSQKWTDVAVMVAFVVFYRLLAYVVVCYKTSHRRR